MRLLKFASEVRAGDDGVITAVLSTESVDRDGDVVRLDGWDLANFAKAPRLLSCHDYSRITAQIGEWRNVRVDPQRKALVGEAHYYTGQGNVEADWAYFLASQGQATYSVGFMPKESAPRKGAMGRVYTSQELLEVSHVPVPSQPDALQLMAKAAQWTDGSRRKWASNYMGDPDGFGPTDIHCIVAGCDDAAQTTVPICSEHLRYLMMSPPQPPGSPSDDDTLVNRGVLRGLARVAKAGKVISAANMGKLHSAMQSLQDVHDAACTDDDCPLDDGSSDDGPPTGKRARRKAGFQPEPYHRDPDETVCCPKCGKYNSPDASFCDQCGTELAGRADVSDEDGSGSTGKAAGESSGSGGGFIAGGVRVTNGSHGPVTGDTTHTHPHSAAGDQGDDAQHSHAHDHADGTSSHTGADHVAAHKHFAFAEHRAAQSTAEQNDLPDSAFAVISPGGEKDDEGKTTPRSLRHLPHHKADGSIDLSHLKEIKNALARVSQTDLSDADRAKAEAHLAAHAKAEGIGEAADDTSKGFEPEQFHASLEDAMTKALAALEAQ